MHYVDIHALDINGKLKKEWTTLEPGLVLGHCGSQLIKVHPQVDGFGYGLTITDMEGRLLLTIDNDGNVISHGGAS